MTTEFRIETDSMGEVKVPANALYQAQTQRAIDNFAFSQHTMPSGFIQALAHIKQTAALTNAQLGLLEGDIANAIADAAQAIIDGQHLDQFPIDLFQTGSGTSSNMNANEVIATLASELLGGNVTRMTTLTWVKAVTMWCRRRFKSAQHLLLNTSCCLHWLILAKA